MRFNHTVPVKPGSLFPNDAQVPSTFFATEKNEEDTPHDPNWRLPSLGSGAAMTRFFQNVLDHSHEPDCLRDLCGQDGRSIDGEKWAYRHS